MKGGKGLKAATQTATTAGSSAGFTAGAAEAVPGMTAAVAEATENGIMAGLRAAYAQMKGYKALPAPSINSTNPIPGNPGEPPLLGDGKTPKGFEYKFKELIDTKFKGSMAKFGLTLAGAAVAAGAVTKGLTWLLDNGITTAGEELEKIGELKDLT